MHTLIRLINVQTLPPPSAGHFYGPLSLLNVLRNYGYAVEAVRADADIR